MTVTISAFVQAKHYRKGGNTPVSRIVIHDMEAAETNTTAEGCANFFAGGTVVASAHYCVDNDSIVQCVREGDVAFHAPPNAGSIGIEHAGFARQTRQQWLDEYGRAMLRLSAQLVAELCAKYDLPMRWLSPSDLRDGRRGITTHNNVSLAFGQSSHTDPGPKFPTGWYLDRVKAAASGPATFDVSDGEGLRQAAARVGETWRDLVEANPSILLKAQTLNRP